MKTDSKVIALFLSTAIWADGEFTDIERDTLKDIASDFELDTLVKDVQDSIAEVASFSAEDLSKKLSESAKQVDNNEKDGILVLCLQLMGCDSYLAKEEINNYFVLANLLGIDTGHAKEVLAELVEEKNI